MVWLQCNLQNRQHFYCGLVLWRVTNCTEFSWLMTLDIYSIFFFLFFHGIGDLRFSIFGSLVVYELKFRNLPELMCFSITVNQDYVFQTTVNVLLNTFINIKTSIWVTNGVQTLIDFGRLCYGWSIEQNTIFFHKKYVDDIIIFINKLRNKPYKIHPRGGNKTTILYYS